MRPIKKDNLDSDARTFEVLVRPHVSALYQTAFKLTGSMVDAEDIVQDTLIKLYPKTHDLKQIKELRPWLTTVVYHQFIDYCRRQRRNPVSLVNRVESAQFDPVEGLLCPYPGPERQAGAIRLSELVLAALNELEREARALVVLHLLEGFTLEELTPVFDVPLGTLKSRLHRAKARLKKKLSVEPFGAIERDRVGSV